MDIRGVLHPCALPSVNRARKDYLQVLQEVVGQQSLRLDFSTPFLQEREC